MCRAPWPAGSTITRMGSTDLCFTSSSRDLSSQVSLRQRTLFTKATVTTSSSQFRRTVSALRRWTSFCTSLWLWTTSTTICSQDTSNWRTSKPSIWSHCTSICVCTTKHARKAATSSKSIKLRSRSTNSTCQLRRSQPKKKSWKKRRTSSTRTNLTSRCSWTPQWRPSSTTNSRNFKTTWMSTSSSRFMLSSLTNLEITLHFSKVRKLSFSLKTRSLNKSDSMRFWYSLS